MSLQKTLTGRFKFAADEASGSSAAQAEFDLIFNLLTQSYRGVVPSTVDGKNDVPPPAQTLPFTVVLSFEERSGVNLIGRIEAQLKTLFDKLLTVAATVGGQLEIARS